MEVQETRRNRFAEEHEKNFSKRIKLNNYSYIDLIKKETFLSLRHERHFLIGLFWPAVFFCFCLKISFAGNCKTFLPFVLKKSCEHDSFSNFNVCPVVYIFIHMKNCSTLMNLFELYYAWYTASFHLWNSCSFFFTKFRFSVKQSYKRTLLRSLLQNGVSYNCSYFRPLSCKQLVKLNWCSIAKRLFFRFLVIHPLFYTALPLYTALQ